MSFNRGFKFEKSFNINFEKVSKALGLGFLATLAGLTVASVVVAFNTDASKLTSDVTQEDIKIYVDHELTRRACEKEGKDYSFEYNSCN